MTILPTSNRSLYSLDAKLEPACQNCNLSLATCKDYVILAARAVCVFLFLLSVCLPVNADNKYVFLTFVLSNNFRLFRRLICVTIATLTASRPDIFGTHLNKTCTEAFKTCAQGLEVPQYYWSKRFVSFGYL